MTVWRIHWLEAVASLAQWRDRIAAEIDAAQTAAAALVELRPLDILVERNAVATIPEIGLGGHSYRRGLCHLSVDPDNSNLAAALAGGALRRIAAHEAHHCLRHEGPGYGKTLGEALVSEGLAGHFVARAFGSAPEPWERAVPAESIDAHFPGFDALAAAGYDHFAWFYGAGGKHPRWLGYTLGFEMAGRWLAENPGADGAELVSVPAADVISVWPAGGRR